MPIAVFGAAGHTGRFVVAELLRRGVEPLPIGRDRDALAAVLPGEALERRLARIDDAESLDRALSGVELVINCAGPFIDTADALLAAALRAGAHYLDVTAEQASAQATFAYFDAARERGIVVVPAMGFYGGLGDLLATVVAGDSRSADEIDIAITLSSWLPTRGTRRTGERNIAPRLVLTGGTLAPLGAAATGECDAVEVPLSETILIARHLRVGELHTYINAAPLRDLDDPHTPPPIASDERGRSEQTFMVDVVARSGAWTRRATVHGRDIYAVTAPLVVEAAQRILHGTDVSAGVYAPGEIFAARDFLASFAPDDVRFIWSGS